LNTKLQIQKYEMPTAHVNACIWFITHTLRGLSLALKEQAEKIENEGFPIGTLEPIV